MLVVGTPGFQDGVQIPAVSLLLLNLSVEPCIEPCLCWESAAGLGKQVEVECSTLWFVALGSWCVHKSAFK